MVSRPSQIFTSMFAIVCVWVLFLCCHPSLSKCQSCISTGHRSSIKDSIGRATCQSRNTNHWESSTSDKDFLYWNSLYTMSLKLPIAEWSTHIGSAEGYATTPPSKESRA